MELPEQAINQVTTANSNGVLITTMVIANVVKNVTNMIILKCLMQVLLRQITVHQRKTTDKDVQSKMIIVVANSLQG